MSITEAALLITAGGAILGAVLLGVRERRRPTLDAATVESTEVNTAAIKQEIKKKSDLTNARRDMHLLDLNRWGFDQVIPWSQDTISKFGRQKVLLLEYAAGRDVPDISLAPFPDMPRPLVD